MIKKPELIIESNKQFEKVNFWGWIYESARAGVSYSAN
jgi:hypothetical protein